MLLGGDELRRTQRGNNNAYCHDNGTSWYDWRYLGAPRGARRTEVLEPQRITPELLEELHQLSAFDPEHLPEEILLTEAFHRRFADLTQIACFDTAFQHDMSRVAKQLPIPCRYEALGARRYGFHGLSYAYLIEELERVAGTKAAHGRVILAHLGNGASLAAVRDGQSVDTTMAFTPAAGLMMSPDRRRTDDCQGGESPARS
jgi:acetate kinase